MFTPVTDDPGVMGNLPRSRPGRRSSKRAGTGDATPQSQTTEVTASAAAAAPKPASGKSAAGRPTAKRATPKKTTAKRTTTAKGAAPSRARTRTRSDEPTTQSPKAASRVAEAPPRSEPATRGGTDPVTGAVLLAGKVVEGGLKVAGGILKRLPRP
jgi:hypothetical protein